eukprot:COSAG06_NODE_15855_length_1039_cov_211.326596_1_plen_23_part_10
MRLRRVSPIAAHLSWNIYTFIVL